MHLLVQYFDKKEVERGGVNYVPCEMSNCMPYRKIYIQLQALWEILRDGSVSRFFLVQFLLFLLLLRLSLLFIYFS